MMWLTSSSSPSADRPAGPPGMLMIETTVTDDEAVLVIAGELDLTTRPVLAERLAEILGTGPRRLILDMAGTDFLDCGSARLIVSAGQFLPEGRRLVVRHPSRTVRRVLELTGQQTSVEIEDDR